MSSLNQIGFVTCGVGSIVIIAIGYLRFKVKLEQIALAEDASIIGLKNLVERAKTEANDVQNVGIYCRLNGTIKTDGKPLLAPESRQKVVAYCTYRGGKLEETHEMPFCLTDGNIDIQVDTSGSHFLYDTIINKRSIKEQILKVGAPLLVIGEVTYDSHKKQCVVKKPVYGRAFIVSAQPWSKVSRHYKLYGAACYIAGAILLGGCTYFGVKMILNTNYVPAMHGDLHV